MELAKGGLKPISPAERLTLTLRFLATGESFRSLSFQFRISKSAISHIVQEVCRAIIANLPCTYLKVPSKKIEWMKIAKQLYDHWNFPNALGAIDGKHITIQKPAGGGSFYYNYKHTHSVVILAISGPNYEQMGDVAMEEYGEIVVLQSCWVMISLVFQNLKKNQAASE